MAEFTALEALTAPKPTERQRIVRAAAELMVKDAYLGNVEATPRNAKAAAIIAAGQLATDAPFYLADLGLYAWARLAYDILTCAQWARDEKWSF